MFLRAYLAMLTARIGRVYNELGAICTCNCRYHAEGVAA